MPPPEEGQTLQLFKSTMPLDETEEKEGLDQDIGPLTDCAKVHNLITQRGGHADSRAQVYFYHCSRFHSVPGVRANTAGMQNNTLL